MRLILIRHGETDWNSEQRVQGRTDTVLNSRGAAQAKAAAAYFANKGITAIYSGPLQRAQSTAKEIAKAAGIEGILTVDELTEINFGAWEGKTNAELMRDFPTFWKDWNWILHPEKCEQLGAESASEILSRSLSALDMIFDQNPQDATVAVISHTMPIKFITAESIGLPIERIRRLRMDNCGAGVLDFDTRRTATLRCWNDTSYLGGLL